MEEIRVIPDLEQQGFQDTEYRVTEFSGAVIIGGMPKGTIEGNPTVMIALDMDSHYLVVETTLKLFLASADALKAKYGDPRY